MDRQAELLQLRMETSGGLFAGKKNVNFIKFPAVRLVILNRAVARSLETPSSFGKILITNPQSYSVNCVITLFIFYSATMKV